jgi:hypothetical protein
MLLVASLVAFEVAERRFELAPIERGRRRTGGPKRVDQSND